MTFTHAVSTDNYGPAKFIVSANVYEGTHTTIATALTSASSGDTIFIRPGTYTENLTLKAGVNLTAFGSDSSLNATGKVIISGTCTMTTAGSVTISGIQLQTNSAALLAVTGSAASIVNLYDCYLNMTNNTGITFSSSSPSALINISSCMGNLGTTGIGIFTHTSAGTLALFYSIISNSGASTTASTCASGAVSLIGSFIANPLTFTSTGALSSCKFSEIDTGATNTTSLTTVLGSVNSIELSRISSGSATPISAGGTVNTAGVILVHSNTVAVSGAGTFVYSQLFQENGVGTISSTGITGRGTIGVISSATPATPPAGYIGELTSAALTVPNTLVVNTITNVTSITPSSGIWEITGSIQYNIATGVGVTNVQGCLATANNNFTVIDNFGNNVSNGVANVVCSLATMAPTVLLGPCRLTTSGATVVNLNAFLAATSAGTRTVTGVIRAVRVA